MRRIGDENSRRDRPLSKPQSELVDGNIEQVDKFAGMVRRRGSVFSYEDLRTLGEDGLIDAAQTYNAATGVPFERFAAGRIHGAMLNGLRREGRYRSRIQKASGAALAYAEDHEDRTDPFQHTEEDVGRRWSAGNDGFVAAFVLGWVSEASEGQAAPAEAKLRAAELAQMVSTAVEALPERDRAILRRRWYDDVPIADVATEVGASERNLRRLHNDALQRLGARLRAACVSEEEP